VLWGSRTCLKSLDAANDIFVVQTVTDSVVKLVNNQGTYGAPVTIASGFTAVTADSAGDIVASDGVSLVEEMRNNNGTYGAPVVVASGLDHPINVAVDTAGRVYVLDQKGTRRFNH
jgi:hypothetical protein